MTKVPVKDGLTQRAQNLLDGCAACLPFARQEAAASGTGVDAQSLVNYHNDGHPELDTPPTGLSLAHEQEAELVAPSAELSPAPDRQMSEYTPPPAPSSDMVAPRMAKWGIMTRFTGVLIFDQNPNLARDAALTPDDLRLMFGIMARYPNNWQSLSLGEVKPIRTLTGGNRVVQTHEEFAPRPFWLLLHDPEGLQAVFEPVVKRCHRQGADDSFVLELGMLGFTAIERVFNGSYNNLYSTTFYKPLSATAWIDPAESSCDVSFNTDLRSPDQTAETTG